MNNKIEYKDQLEIDSLAKEIEFYEASFFHTQIYNTNISECIKQLCQNIKDYKLKNAMICCEKINKYLVECKKQRLNDYKTLDDINEFVDIVKRTNNLCADLIKKGLDNYQEQICEMPEEKKLKIQRQQINKKIKEMQEEKSPYLNFSIGLSLIIVSIVFMCLPTFFNTIVLYHVCGGMLTLGVFLLVNEINIRQSLGWYGYSEKITSKKAFSFLLQAIVYMIPLSVLYYFFSQQLIVKILFFIQIWFCSTLMINGISILIVTNITKNKEKKFNVWNFILGIITIAAFVLQLLQIFKVL